MMKQLPRDAPRMGKIFTAGLKPQATYAAAVTGFTESELTALRKTLLAPKHPLGGKAPLAL